MDTSFKQTSTFVLYRIHISHTHYLLFKKYFLDILINIRLFSQQYNSVEGWTVPPTFNTLIHNQTHPHPPSYKKGWKWRCCTFFVWALCLIYFDGWTLEPSNYTWTQSWAGVTSDPLHHLLSSKCIINWHPGFGPICKLGIQPPELLASNVRNSVVPRNDWEC